MIDLKFLSKILGGLALLLSVTATLFTIKLGSKRKAFVKKMEEYQTEAPEESVSEEEADEIAKEFEDLFVKPLRNNAVLLVTAAILGVISILLR